MENSNSDVNVVQFHIVNQLLIFCIAFIAFGDMIPPLKKIVNITINPYNVHSINVHYEVEDLRENDFNYTIVPTYEYLLKLAYGERIIEIKRSNNKLFYQNSNVGNEETTKTETNTREEVAGDNPTRKTPANKEIVVELPAPKIMNISVK
jgi:hypothetical protein